MGPSSRGSANAELAPSQPAHPHVGAASATLALARRRPDLVDGSEDSSIGPKYGKIELVCLLAQNTGIIRFQVGRVPRSQLCQNDPNNRLKYPKLRLEVRVEHAVRRILLLRNISYTRIDESIALEDASATYRTESACHVLMSLARPRPRVPCGG
jgi:hypothetical protein